MTLPLVILFYEKNFLINSIKQIIIFGVTVCIVAVISFLPPIIAVNGFGFLKYAENNGYDILNVIKVFSIEVWGLFGTIALVITVISIVINLIKPKKMEKNDYFIKKYVISILLIIILYLIIFFRLPHEPAYLLPLVPFVMVLSAVFSDKRVHIVFCLLVVLSSFIGLESIRHLKVFSPIISDHIERIEEIKYIDDVVKKVNELNNEVIMAGYYIPKIELNPFNQKHDSVYLYSISKQDLFDYKQKSKKIYYLRYQNEYNYYLNGYYLSKEGAEFLDDSIRKKN
jgi:hypothetical protein